MGREHAVHRLGVDARHDQIRVDAPAVGKLYSGCPATRTARDRDDRLVEQQARAKAHSPLRDGLAELVQAAREVPAAVATLDMRDDREGRRCPAWIGAGIGRIPVQEHPQPVVGQMTLAEPTQGQPRRDGGDVARTP